MNEMEEMALLFSEQSIYSSIDDTRADLEEFIQYMYSQEWQLEQIKFMANLRDLKPETLIEARSFMYMDDFVPEERFMEAHLGLSYYIFRGRFIYPVFNTKGIPIGVTGYDKFETPKYRDSATFGYKAKHSTFYGMENLPTYYDNNNPVIFVEGAVCCLWLKQEGFQSLALLGSYLSPYMAQIIRRFGRRAIVIPDSDEAGNKLARSIKYNCPEARIIRVISDKDVDDSRRVNPLLAENLRKMIKNPFMKLKL